MQTRSLRIVLLLCLAVTLVHAGNDFAGSVLDRPSVLSGAQEELDKAAGGASGNWVARYNGPDEAHVIAVDASHNVFVAGYTIATSAINSTTVKYDANGQRVWAKTYNGPGNAEDDPLDMAVDAVGNGYVVGESRGKTTGYDCMVLRYGN
jgi:hypothetical protein